MVMNEHGHENTWLYTDMVLNGNGHERTWSGMEMVMFVQGQETGGGEGYTVLRSRGTGNRRRRGPGILGGGKGQKARGREG